MVFKLEFQDFGVVFGLLQSCGWMLVLGLCFDDCDWEISGVTQDVVRSFSLPAGRHVAVNNDAPVSEETLLGNGVRVAVQARRLELGRDQCPASIGFSGHRG